MAVKVHNRAMTKRGIVLYLVFACLVCGAAIACKSLLAKSHSTGPKTYPIKVTATSGHIKKVVL